MASAGAKATTNLARLAVARNPHHSLGVLYSKNLRALAKMPNEYAYRKNTEQVRYKSKIDFSIPIVFSEALKN